jgi:hypothetical protein
MSKKTKINFRKAIDVLLQDYLKDIIKSLLVLSGKTIWNIYGASILLVLSAVFLGFASWLKIPITLPAYVVAISIVTIILGVLIFQKLHMGLKAKQNNIIYEELLWEIDTYNNILGPSCPKCKEKMIVASDQHANTTNLFFGQPPEYTFTCRCGHQVKRNKSTSEMIRSIQSLLKEKKSG